MIPEFTAAISAITALGQAAKSVGGVLETTSDFKAKEVITKLQNGVLDLQTKVYAAQAKYQELADIKLQVEQKLIAYEKWDSESARYQLTELTPGIFVYMLKPEKAAGEPIHYLCPHCFQQHKKAILHHPSADHTNYVCDGCEFDVRPVPAPTVCFETIQRSPNRIDGLF